MKRKIMSIVVFLTLVMTAFAIMPSNISAATPEEIEQSINDGIAWLITQQNSVTGAWQSDAAITGFVLIKLQDRASELGYESPFDPAYPYSSNVLAGWDYLLTAGTNVGLYAQKQTIGVQTYGDPDSNGNDYGIYFEGGSRDVYYTGICLMAIAATGTPNRANDGGLDYDLDGDADTYGEIAQEVVDWLAWAQEETGSHTGGWRYRGNYGSSDNSVAGYAVLGLAAAEGFGYPTQQWVKDLLNTWIDYIQNDPGTGDDYLWAVTPDGGSGYSNPMYWVNMLKTGNLIFEMTFVGDGLGDTRFDDALDYIERHWHDTNYHPGWGYNQGTPAHYQSMYCLMKGLEYSGIALIELDGIGDPEHDWYLEFADVLVNQQHDDGYWVSSPCYVWYTPPYSWGTMSSTILSTVWNLLNLEKITPPPPVIEVEIDIKPGSYPNSINPKSKGNVPVAILTTDDFDASDVDPTTIVFLDAAPIQWAMDDVDFDGDLDMIFHFKTQELDFDLLVDEGGEYPYAYLTGETNDGQSIEGKDTVRLVGRLQMLFETLFVRIMQFLERIVQIFQ